MAYFIFNPQTNSLDDSDHPTPIRKNLGQKLLAEKPGWQYAPWQDYPEDDDIPSVQKMATGGRVGFENGTQINISALGKKYIRRKNPLQPKWQKVLDWLKSLKPGSTINLKDMVADPKLGLTGVDDYNTLWSKINSDVKGKGSQVFKDAVKNLKISRTPSSGKAHQLRTEFRDLKSTYADELITKIDELTKNPQFKTWQQVEKELIKLFNKAPYNVSKGVAASPFFDKTHKIFRVPNEFQIYGGPFAEGTKLGSQPRTYQSKLKQIIISKFLENKNKNFEPLRKALEKFYVRNSKVTVNMTDAEKALIRQFIKDVRLTPSKTTPSGKTANILTRFLKQQNYNFKNVFNPVIHILNIEDALEGELNKKGISQNRKNLLNRELKAIKNQKYALIKRLNRRFNNIFTGDNALQVEHKIAKMFRESKATKLPFDYIARGVHVPGRFNQVKYFKFDAPLEGLINEYARPGRNRSQNEIRTDIEELKKDFNKRSNGYLKDVEFKYGKDKVKMIDKTPLFSQLDDADVAKNIAKNVNHSNAYFRSFGNQTIGGHKAKDFIIKGNDVDNFIKAASKGNNAFKSSLVLGMEELPWSKIGATAGKALRGLGLVAAPLDVIPFAQQMERGMGIRSADTGLARLGEDILNLPHLMEDLTDMIGLTDPDTKSMEKLYEPFKFGRKYSDKVAAGIGDEKRMKNIEQLALAEKYRGDEVYDALGDTSLIGEVDVEKLKKEALLPLGPEEEETETVTFDRFNVAQGGIVPRIGYRDGPTLGDARGWEKMLDMSDPDVVAKLEAKKVMDEQKDAEYRNKAHEKRLLHRTDDYYTSQDESFIPHYVKDVAKTTFGTQEGRQYFGSKLLEGAVEGTEWLVMQIPHLMSKVNPVGLMKLQKEMEEGNFSWMDLLYEPKLGEKWGMNKYQQAKLEELREQAIAEGKPGIPQGVETLGTTGELGAMFADPFVMYGAYRKLAPHLKTKKRGIEEQVDEGRRDTLKTLGAGGLMVALAKIFPGIFKDTKALKAAGTAKKVGQTVKQFGNVRGMPDWFPSFMLKATQKGKLKSLPDKDYIEPMVYELMLPVKIRLGKGKIKTKEVPVTVTQNPNSGEMSVTWTGTDNYGDDIERTINYKPGETGTQNYAADEYGRGTSKEEVVIQDPEFEYVEPDYSSQGFEDTSPDSASFLDIHDEADEIVEAMEEFVKGADDKFKKKAADDFRLYNQTDEHLGDATGHQTSDGDWVSGEDNMPFPSYDKEVKDVYHPKWNRKKKAMGGVASGPPPLSGPVPQGLPSLQPGDIYNEWIK